MDYLMTFIEGIASFISPCVLPMLPIYISYFAGKDEEKKNNVENLIIKIQNIDYNPKGSDKNNESITLSIFDKSKMIKSLDFNNQF